jgi:hypothetical protein
MNEELGGIVVDAKVIPIEQYTSDSGIFVYHTFLIQVDDEFVPILNSEHNGYCWVTIDVLPKPLHPGLEKTLQSSAIKQKLSNSILVEKQLNT